MFNNLYSKSKDKEDIWNELEINCGSLTENNILSKGKDIEYIISKLEKEEISELAHLINNKKELEKETDCKDFLIQQDAKDIIFINAFVKRKKQAIDEFYSHKYNDADETYISGPLVKSYHIYTDKHEDLFQIKTLYEWNSKGTGFELKSNEKIKNWSIIDNILKDEKFEKEFTDYLYEKSKDNKKYKIAAYCQIDEKNIIFMIYKLHRDSQQVDFDKSKRVKDIEKILFKIEKDKELIHIKSKFKIDMLHIKSYFEDKLKCEFEMFEDEIYTEYDAENFKNTFCSLEIKNNPKLVNFQIDKIVFSESLLDKSPEIALSLPKKDIWPAVVSAVNSNIICIESLSSIKSLNINYNDSSRNIRSFSTEDGSVVFKLDDKSLDNNIKQEISDRFNTYFGIPLNRKINDKLNRGKANMVDLILRVKDKEKIEKSNYSLLENLVMDKLVEYKNKIKYRCNNTDCNKEIESPIEEFKKCTVCGNDSYYKSDESETIINEKLIIKLISTIIRFGLNLTEIKESNIKIKNKKIKLHRFEYNNNRYQIFITDTVINKNIFKEIEKQLIPTIIIYYGVDNSNIKSMTPNTMEGIQFGILYVNKDDKTLINKYLVDVIESLDKRKQNHISSAATYANDNLRMILNKKPEDINGKYTDDDLENDVAAMLKDIFYNSAKWGKEDIGEAIPEGVVAMHYIQSEGTEGIEKNYVFSYDCKMTEQNKGYDLGKNEKRKAQDYVNKINRTPQIKSYCSAKQLSAHLFIGNQFKSKQIEAMTKSFINDLPKTCTTKPMFIEVKILLKLHDWYRKNYEDLKLNMNQFYEYLYIAFTNDDNIMTDDVLDELFDNVKAYFKLKLDTEKLKKNIINK